MFGRGNWAILGLTKESLDVFKSNLDDQLSILAASQMAASAITRHLNRDSLGINPYGSPRLDEQQPIGLDQEPSVVHFATTKKENRAEVTLPAGVLERDCFAHGVPLFQIHPTLPWFGLWAVANQWKDISDLASVKEQHSYSVLDRPYKFLQTTDKKNVDKDTRGATAAMRKQFAVLLDFHEGRLYIENSNKKVLFLVKETLKQLGAEIVPVAWTYNRANWHSEILNKLYESSHYLSDFQKRADEMTRFRVKEIEKLDDRELEKLVSKYFSMSPLSTEQQHTIRAERKHLDQSGSLCHLYTGLRTKSARLILRAPCVRVDEITIFGSRVWLGGDELSEIEKDALAWHDGFRHATLSFERAGCFALMQQFWREKHGNVPFHGHMTHWDFARRTK